MPTRFCMLASGSSGNSGLLQIEQQGLLIDLGLPPRTLAYRLAHIGATWNTIRAAILTHTHGDHWKDETLRTLLNHKIQLYCHPDHHTVLLQYSRAFALLHHAGLVRDYHEAEDVSLINGLNCRPIAVSHDAEPTFGFVFSGNPGLFGPSWRLAYFSDLGSWSESQLKAVEGVDVLAVEFNHDERMQRESGRPSYLIGRVLGDRGHLSNRQAAQFLDALIRRGTIPLDVVQLHLSQECNTSALARGAAQRVLTAHGLTSAIHTAEQDNPAAILRLDLLDRRRVPSLSRNSD